MDKEFEDYNKDKRTIMWWCLILFFLSIPLFLYFDNTQYRQEDFVTVDNLVLAEDSYKDSGGGKGSTPSINFRFLGTERGFGINYDEYQCVSNREMLYNFKKGDMVSVRILKKDSSSLYETTFLSKHTKLFGIKKSGKEYIDLNCRNSQSTKRTNAAAIASGVSALLSVFFAVVVLRPMNRHKAVGHLPFDPLFIVLLSWIITCLALR